MTRGLGARCAAFTAAGAIAAAMACGSASAEVVVHPGARIDPLLSLNRISNDTVSDLNWAGYAAQAPSQFTDVKGSWVEPAVNCSGFASQYASFWAGIDGYSSNSVEQLGTDSDCSRGRASYYAWYEMYPAYTVDLSTRSYPVRAGDTLSAEVSVSGSTFTLTLADSNEHWTFKTTQTGSGLAQSSAELIAESPELCYSSTNCSIAPLSNFGTINFMGAQAAVNGGADAPLSTFTADSGPHEIVATTNRGAVKMQPSSLSSAGAFGVTWEHS